MIFSLFHFIRSGKKGQLASLLIVILVAVLIFAFVSVNLGKLGLQRTRTSNAADAASLAAASVASQLLNYMAGYNEMMLLNMSGFVATVMLVIVQYILDIVQIISFLLIAFGVHTLGPIAEGAAAINVVFALGSLELTLATMLLLIEGATKVGEFLEKRTRELNAKLPKDTRNSARQYAFNNAGIDEPKIDYKDWLAQTGRTDDDPNAWIDYLNVETNFGAFTRTLSNTNEADTNFSANNLMSFSWQDTRRAGQVNNTVEVYTTPIQPLYLESKDFGDVASDSGLRDEMNSAIDNADVSSLYQSWFQLGITMAPLIKVFLTVIIQLISILLLLLAVYMVVAGVLEGVYAVCCAYGVCCNQLAGIITFNVYAAIWIGLATIIAATTFAIDPSGIPCLVYGNDSNDLTLSTEIRRSATPVSGNLDYGLWRMQYPTVTSFSKAEVYGSGGGRLFPPWQDYTSEIISVR